MEDQEQNIITESECRLNMSYVGLKLHNNQQYKEFEKTR